MGIETPKGVFSFNENYNVYCHVLISESASHHTSLAQLRWIYTSPLTKHYAIGLYHGDKSKHVLIYINNRISVIDFHVREDKTYSFFIEEELCELSLKDEGDKWTYAFQINREVLTPANKIRRNREKKHLLYSILFLISLVLAIILLGRWVM